MIDALSSRGSQKTTLRGLGARKFGGCEGAPSQPGRPQPRKLGPATAHHVFAQATYASASEGACGEVHVNFCAPWFCEAQIEGAEQVRSTSNFKCAFDGDFIYSLHTIRISAATTLECQQFCLVLYTFTTTRPSGSSYNGLPFHYNHSPSCHAVCHF